MWSVIAAVIAAIGSGIKLASNWLAAKRDQLLLTLGKTQQSNVDLQGRIDALGQANKLREGARSNLERNPADWMSDDGFRRKDGDE